MLSLSCCVCHVYGDGLPVASLCRVRFLHVCRLCVIARCTGIALCHVWLYLGIHDHRDVDDCS